MASASSPAILKWALLTVIAVAATNGIEAAIMYMIGTGLTVVGFSKFLGEKRIAQIFGVAKAEGKQVRLDVTNTKLIFLKLRPDHPPRARSHFGRFVLGCIDADCHVQRLI